MSEGCNDTGILATVLICISNLNMKIILQMPFTKYKISKLKNTTHPPDYVNMSMFNLAHSLRSDNTKIIAISFPNIIGNLNCNNKIKHI